MLFEVKYTKNLANIFDTLKTDNPPPSTPILLQQSSGVSGVQINCVYKNVFFTHPSSIDIQMDGQTHRHKHL